MPPDRASSSQRDHATPLGRMTPRHIAPQLRISEALALQESDLDRSRGAVLLRHGKGGKRRAVGMDRWAWDQLDAVRFLNDPYRLQGFAAPGLGYLAEPVVPKRGKR